MSHGMVDKRAVQMNRAIVKKEGNFSESWLIQKLF